MPPPPFDYSEVITNYKRVSNHHISKTTKVKETKNSIKLSYDPQEEKQQLQQLLLLQNTYDN